MPPLDRIDYRYGWLGPFAPNQLPIYRNLFPVSLYDRAAPGITGALLQSTLCPGQVLRAGGYQAHWWRLCLGGRRGPSVLKGPMRPVRSLPAFLSGS